MSFPFCGKIQKKFPIVNYGVKKVINYFQLSIEYSYEQ